MIPQQRAIGSPCLAVVKDEGPGAGEARETGDELGLEHVQVVLGVIIVEAKDAPRRPLRRAARGVSRSTNG
jgi:hypothetical protein